MAREMIRQGGRSARIQEAVHEATQALLKEVGRGEINVPMIAERAGVTPSTVYRRWGDLAQLLADVAAERLRPVAEPDDTGSLSGDLQRVRHAICGGNGLAGRPGVVARRAGGDRTPTSPPQRCCAYTTDHLQTLNSRALASAARPASRSTKRSTC